MRARVVFPEPDSPTIPTLSCSPTSMETPSSAVTWRAPFLKTFRASWTAMSGADSPRAEPCGLVLLAHPGGAARPSRPGSRAGERRRTSDLARLRPVAGFARCRRGGPSWQRGANTHEPATSSGAGTEPGDRDQFAGALLGRRLGEKQPEAIGVQRLGVELGRAAHFDQGSGVEHVDAIADSESDPQVVRDQDQAHASRGLDALDQRKDLPLRGDVERGGGLVGDQDPRVAGQGRRDRHPLPHPARELERIAVGHRRVADPHLR